MGSPEAEIGKQENSQAQQSEEGIMSPEVRGKLADLGKKILVGALAIYGGARAYTDTINAVLDAHHDEFEKKMDIAAEKGRVKAQTARMEREADLQKDINAWAELMSEMAAGGLGKPTAEEAADLAYLAQSRRFVDTVFEKIFVPQYPEAKVEIKKEIDGYLRYYEKETLEHMKYEQSRRAEEGK